MRQLLLTAALGLCACSEGFHSVGFFDKVDTMIAGNKTISVLRAGDLNGDGRADIVLANYTSELSVLFSMGDGNFAAGVSYPIDNIGNQAARSMVVGDLNGDGRADVIVGNIEQNNVQIFMNQGDGRLVALQQSSMDVGCRPTYMVLYDMNADGKPDLVVGCTGINEVHVLKNQGQGQGPALTLSFASSYTHQWTTATSANNPPPAIGFAVGELNGDSSPDIAVATDNDLRILNSPKEAGRDYKDYLVSMPLSVRPYAIGIGDINGNGHPDIAALVEAKSVQVFEYATGGAYTQLVDYQNLGMSGRTTTQTLGVVELSSDTKTDMVVMLQNPSEIKVAVSRGETGIVAAPVTLSYQYPTGLQICDGCLTFGDISGDGRTDIVLRNNNKVSVLLSASR